MDTITNTSKDERHPEWTLGGNPEAIYAQEARGQTEFVNSHVLPDKAIEKRDTEPVWDQLAALGVERHDLVSDDPMFVNVTLPEGWSKQATDHSMWSELVNAEGTVIAKIFYKAAFYDRSAHISMA